MVLRRSPIWPDAITKPVAGAARIDYGHPLTAAIKPEVVVLFRGSLGVQDLQKSQFGVLQGNPTHVILPFLESAFGGDGTGDAVEFAGRPTAASTSDVTLMVLAVTTSLTTDRVALATSAATNAGFRLQHDANSLVFAKGNVADVDSGILLTANVPYALLISHLAGSTVNWVVRRMDTGSISTATQSHSSAPQAGDGIYAIGGARVFSSNMWLGQIGMAVIGTGFVPMGMLIAWSRDPYAFLRPVIRRRWFVPAAADTLFAQAMY